MKTSRADKYFSLFIRVRDADENGLCTCITCGRIAPAKSFDNSHFIGRQHMATRFSEMNCHAACKKCNGFEEGKKDVYEKFLLKKYGQDKVDLLKLQGNQTRKITNFELNEIAKYYKEQAEKLAKSKNLKLW